MLQQSPKLKQHFVNQQNAVDAEKLRELQKCHLFNEKTFYPAFIKDMLAAKKEIVIHSPFVTKFRSEFFKKTLAEIRKRNIAVFIFTRPLEEQDYFMRSEIACALNDYKELGVCVIHTQGYIHEKFAIIDREILWEGSLNILSQRESREIMRRISDGTAVEQVMSYLGLDKKLAEGYKFQYEWLYNNLVESSKRSIGLKNGANFIRVVASVLVWLFVVLTKMTIVILKGVRIVFGFVGFLYKKKY